MNDKIIFKAGTKYALRTSTVHTEKKVWKKNLEGTDQEHLLQGKELVIYIQGEDGKEYTFVDGRIMDDGVNVADRIKTDFDFQTLVGHFEIPEVQDVSVCRKAEYELKRNQLGEIERLMNRGSSKFKFKTFQVEDYARASLTNGCIFAADTGLGKSIAAATLPLLWLGFDEETFPTPHGRALLIAPEGLHAQLKEEFSSKFGIKTITIDCQKTYLEMKRLNGGRLPNAYYISSYTQIASNKVEDWPDLTGPFDGKQLGEFRKLFSVTAEDIAKEPEAFGDNVRSFDDRVLDAIRKKSAMLQSGVGKEVRGIRCVYSPSLAELCKDEFDCVIIDEGTKIKGQSTLMGQGVRLMNPKYRAVLTATPIKNRLGDVFHLASFACGGNAEATARWPYTNEPGEQEKFETEFLVTSRNLSKERENNHGRELNSRKRGGGRRVGTPTANVCNLTRLWKMLAPILLRRRKTETGETIVSKLKHPIYVPMGAMQTKVYRYHLTADYVDKHGRPAYGAQLQALRSAAAAPNSELLKAPTDRLPGFDELVRSPKDYIPKLAAALTVIEEVLKRGEQVVVFSSFHEPLDTLSRRLTSAGVPHDVLDGRKSAAVRGRLAAEFKRGLPFGKPVMLAGSKAMGEGHSFSEANNVIMLSQDWALDTMIQSINRVHRLNSKKDVNVYPIMCEGSIDIRLESLLSEKENASDLVLDGKLFSDPTKQIDLSELLKDAAKSFASGDHKTIDEATLEESWPALRTKLGEAWQECQKLHSNDQFHRAVKEPVPVKLPVHATVNVPILVNTPKPEPVKPSMRMPVADVRTFIPASEGLPSTFIPITRLQAPRMAYRNSPKPSVRTFELVAA